jgi:protein gp37
LRERELLAPLRQKKPAVIGVQFMGDLFHEAVPDEFIFQTLAEICRCRGRHTFLILTKRPKRMRMWFHLAQGREPGWFSPSGQLDLWETYLGLTVCNQAEADEKIPIFLQVPGKKFLSLEPLLGPINITPYINRKIHSIFCREALPSPATGVVLGDQPCRCSWIDAVVLGGETGPGARPMHPDWVRGVRDQCQAAEVPFFFKQWGEWLPPEQSDDMSLDGKTGCFDEEVGFFESRYIKRDQQTMIRVGKKLAGRILDGRTHDDLPWVKP